MGIVNSKTTKLSLVSASGSRQQHHLSGLRLKANFKSLIESHLSQLRKNSQMKENLKVFDITFSYKQTKIFELLAKRGFAIHED